MSVVAITSSRTSPGASTLAAGLAIAWSHINDRSLLIEADPAGGVLALRFGLNAAPSLTSFGSDTRNGYDQDLVWANTQDLRGTHCMPAPVDPLLARSWIDRVAPSLIEELPRLGAPAVIDLGWVDHDGVSAKLAEAADTTLIVTRPDVAEIQALLFQVRRLKAMDTNVALVTIGDSPNSPHEIAAIAGVPLVAVVPDDPKVAAALAGANFKPAKFRRSLLWRTISGLAESLLDTDLMTTRTNQTPTFDVAQAETPTPEAQPPEAQPPETPSPETPSLREHAALTGPEALTEPLGIVELAEMARGFDRSVSQPPPPTGQPLAHIPPPPPTPAPAAPAPALAMAPPPPPSAPEAPTPEAPAPEAPAPAMAPSPAATSVPAPPVPATVIALDTPSAGVPQPSTTFAADLTSRGALATNSGLAANGHSPSTSHAALVLPDGEQRDLAVGDAFTIGRHSSCDIVLADNQVSRQHGRLVRTDNGWHYTDLGSRNGTEVNDRICSEARLACGDVLVIGQSELTFQTTQQREMESA